MVLRYRRHSLDKNLAPSTINVRLAAIKSLVEMARKLGKTTVDLGDIESIKSESYRDTRGISVEQFKSMLEAIVGSPTGGNPSTPIGVRDYAIMLLFWGNALRRGEIASANVEDFLPQQQKLMILGKGKRAKVATAEAARKLRSDRSRELRPGGVAEFSSLQFARTTAVLS